LKRGGGKKKGEIDVRPTYEGSEKEKGTEKTSIRTKTKEKKKKKLGS